MPWLKTITKYRRIWWMTASAALQETFVNRGANLLFFLGKAVRFTIATIFLLLIRANVTEVGGYSANVLIVFYVTYQAIDVMAQVFYRGVYEFGDKIRTGNFDGILTKPVNALFNVLTGSPDINDAFFFVASTAVSIYLVATADLHITLASLLLYCFLLLNSFLIATAIHIFILCITLLTTDVDNVIFMYRDISKLGQFPVTIYFSWLRTALFFIVPIGLMVTIPTQVLVQLQPSYSIVFSSLFGVGFFLLSVKTWDWAVKKYSSASS